MIKNFEEFYAAQKESDYTMTADNLSLAEQTILKVIVSTWGDNELTPAIRVLNDYYGMTVPNNILINIFQSDLELACENATLGISDSCQRELLVDAVLKQANMRPWPTYGEGQEVYNQFIDELPTALAKIGATIEC